MTFPTRRRVRARGGFRRTKRAGGTWSRLVLEPAIIGPSTKVLIGTGVLSNAGIGETVRRTLGHIYIASDQNAVNENQWGAFGMIVANDLAIAAGAASIPGPDTDRDDDGWFVWQGFSQTLRFGSAVGFGDIGRVYPFDSRGMRRVEEGFGFALMAENADATHSYTIGVAMSLYGTRN